MAKIKVLQFAGGEIHDWKGVGEEVEATMKEAGEFELTRVNEDLNVFTTDLSGFDVVVFHYTVGSITDAQRDGLFNFVKSGKGFVGIHSAADSFRDSPEFRDFIGGFFVTHPRYRSYQVSVLDEKHPITEGLDEFVVTDEQYITDYDPRLNVLATGLYKGKAFPVIWTKSFGKGKICYNALGHDGIACKNLFFKQTLVRGIKWAAAQA